MLNIVIPIQEESWKLEDCVKSVERYTTNYTLTIHKNPTINVAEARQQAMDENKEKYICFLDDDSRLTHSGWSEALIDALVGDRAVAFAEEDWGTEKLLVEYPSIVEVQQGPAACMMVNTEKIPNGFKWDKYIGLSSGWLGGDYEEYDYIQRLRNQGIFSVGVPGARFLHADRVPVDEFIKTDRYITGRVMNLLIDLKNMSYCDPEFFKKLQYVKANPNNDLMLAPGETLKKCFYDVLSTYGLHTQKIFKQLNIV